MAIEIIKPGRLPQAQPMRFECTNCHCEFSATAMDATEVDDQREGNYYVVDCPTCKRPVTRYKNNGAK